MMRSMFAGVSGLRSHQVMMDVVGNNIANVNTAGFKASTTTFAETISQVIRGASGASDARGGSNPIQVGLGVKVGSVDGIFTDGATQTTGRNTDLAIQGAGFFIVANGDERFYTRAGSFSFDEIGNLTAAGGFKVMGWTASSGGVVDTNSPIDSLTLPVGQVIDPISTTRVDIGGNLTANAAIGDVVTSSITTFDSLGNEHEVLFTLTNTGTNAWSSSASVNGTAYTLTPSTITFDSAGNLSSASPLVFSGFTPPGATAMSFNVRLDGPSPIVQFGGASTVEATDQDGQAIGFLRNFDIGDDGTIVGQFSNGENKVLAQIAMAAFNNPSGLARVGNTQFRPTTNSGEPLIGAAGTGSRGFLAAGTIEMSNVDLAREFTNLIIAQRGFQANSRVITTSDEMLAELVNLKR